MFSYLKFGLNYILCYIVWVVYVVFLKIWKFNEERKLYKIYVYRIFICLFEFIYFCYIYFLYYLKNNLKIILKLCLESKLNILIFFLIRIYDISYRFVFYVWVIF